MTDRSITQISLPGSSGKMPTGAMQFQDDWPGLFIRGDEAIMMMIRIRRLVERLGNSEDLVVVSALLELSKFADIIERDVIVR